jgi:hypothetical protein
MSPKNICLAVDKFKTTNWRTLTMGKILRMDREKEAIEKALDALYTLPVEQIVVAARFADRSEEVFFYGNPKEIIQLLALAQFQIGFRYPLGVWDKEKDDGKE